MRSSQRSSSRMPVSWFFSNQLVIFVCVLQNGHIRRLQVLCGMQVGALHILLTCVHYAHTLCMTATHQKDLYTYMYTYIYIYIYNRTCAHSLADSTSVISLFPCPPLVSQGWLCTVNKAAKKVWNRWPNTHTCKHLHTKKVGSWWQDNRYIASICIYVCVCLCGCVGRCVGVWVHVCTCTYTHVDMYMHMRMIMRMYMYVYMWIYTYV